jgi:hypothetical protein
VNGERLISYPAGKKNLRHASRNERYCPASCTFIAMICAVTSPTSSRWRSIFTGKRRNRSHFSHGGNDASSANVILRVGASGFITLLKARETFEETVRDGEDGALYDDSVDAPDKARVNATRGGSLVIL